MGAFVTSPNGGSDFLGTNVNDMLTTFNTQDPANPTIDYFFSMPMIYSAYFYFDTSTDVAECSQAYLSLISAAWNFSNDIVIRMCTCGMEVLRKVDNYPKQPILTSDFDAVSDIEVYKKTDYEAWFSLDFSDAQSSTQCIIDTWHMTIGDVNTPIPADDPLVFDNGSGSIFVKVD